MLLPISRAEAEKRGWNTLDVIFVTGDAYIDHPAFGVPLLARWLEFHGFRVGIIPQPDWRSKDPFMVLGRPRLFFAVTAGAMDSMVAHYTPARKLRRDDAYTPGNRHGARPNRATIVYTSRLKEAYKDVPVVIGGIEASMRRFAHYDFWEDKVRRSILLDAKADLLLYGMGERSLLELAQRLRDGEGLQQVRDIRGSAYVMTGSPPTVPGDSAEQADFPVRSQSVSNGVPTILPSYEEVAADRRTFATAFRLMSQQGSYLTANIIIQPHGDRLLICNPPALPMTTPELDSVYALPFVKSPHPVYAEPIPAYEQIRTSITSHRGCFGGCAFCAITHHQGKTVQSRSEQSIVAEVERLVQQRWFRGTVSDMGGPTANMYGTGCGDSATQASCRRDSCLFPQPCRHLDVGDRRLAGLLKRLRGVRGVKQVVVSSGIRHDLLAHQPEYLRELLAHHVGGLLKVAPEHLVDSVTALMRKPGHRSFLQFMELFRRERERLAKKQSVVPYLMSGHPGCTLADMAHLALALKRNGLKVEQVQDFTPTPGTLSTCMYHTGIDPNSGKELYVARTDREKKLQKALILYHVPGERKNVLAALRECGQEVLAKELLGTRRRGGEDV